jgi:hypothetical protein
MVVIVILALLAALVGKLMGRTDDARLPTHVYRSKLKRLSKLDKRQLSVVWSRD